MSDIKLYYFDARGRAEPIRLCLAVAGKEYEDIRLSREEWATHKAKSPFGHMPYIVYNGKAYGETSAVTGFVARECGLAGKNNEEQLRVDQVYSLTVSLIQAIVKAHFEQDGQKKAGLTTELKEETIPKYLGFFQRLLKESGTGYFVGKTLTLADLAVQDITFALRQEYADVVDTFPEVKEMIKKVEGHEKVKAYLASRKVTQF